MFGVRSLVGAGLRAALIVPVALALVALGNDPQAVAVAVLGGVGPGTVPELLAAVPHWPLVVLAAVGVAVLDPDPLDR